MDLRQLDCFVAVAEEASFTRAATRLHIVQSTVSATISALERELDAPLFVRTTRRVDLTDAGLELLPKARAALDAVRDAYDAVHAVRGGLRGTLRIGTMSSLGIIDLPALLGRFHQEHPAVAVQLATAASGGGSPGLVTAVAEGRLDLAFVSVLTRPPADVCLIRLASSPLRLVVPRDHRLATRRSVAISELATESFIDFPSSYGNRAIVDQAFAVAGLRRHVPIEITDIESGAEFVRNRLGVAFLPESGLRADGDLVALEIDAAQLHWPISLAMPMGRSPGAAATTFKELVQAALAAHRSDDTS